MHTGSLFALYIDTIGSWPNAYILALLMANNGYWPPAAGNFTIN